MRRPAGTGFCCPMISFTLETALGVSETGGVFFASGLTSGTVGFTSGTVGVAIRISLALKSLNYRRGGKPGAAKYRAGQPGPSSFDARGRWKIPASGACQRVYNICVRPFLSSGCLPTHPGIRGSCLSGLQIVEVSYELDVDSFNAWPSDRVGRFHRRSDHSPHLPQHAYHARG